MKRTILLMLAMSMVPAVAYAGEGAPTCLSVHCVVSRKPSYDRELWKTMLDHCRLFTEGNIRGRLEVHDSFFDNLLLLGKAFDEEAVAAYNRQPGRDFWISSELKADDTVPTLPLKHPTDAEISRI